MNSPCGKFRSPSCEIVSDLCPKPLSHDWHVQPSCQRPNHPPPERRAFSPARERPETHPTVLETLQTYRAHESPVNAYIPQNFHVFSTTGIPGRRARGRKTKGLTPADQDQLQPRDSKSHTSRPDPDLTLELTTERATVWPSARKKRSFQRTAFQAVQRRKTEN